MQSNQRVIIAILLSFVVLYGYQLLVPAPRRLTHAAGTAAGNAEAVGVAPAGASEAPGAAAAGRSDTAGATPANAETTPGATGTAATTTTQPAPAATLTDTAEHDVVVDTKLVHAVFSNRGGVLTNWTLKKYTGTDGKAVDLVPASLPPNEARPFSLRLSDPARTGLVNTALFHSSANGPIDATSRPVTFTFAYEDQSGFRVKKAFTISPDSYVITFSVDASDGKAPLNPVVQWGPGLGDSVFLANQNSRFATYNQHSQAIVQVQGQRSPNRLPALKVQQQPTWQGDYPFAGIDDHYFIAALVRPGVARLTYRPTLVQVPATDAQPAGQRELMSFDILFATPPSNVRVFIGPKDFDVLAAVDDQDHQPRQLVNAIYYGIFQVIAVPLLHALKWINSFVGNYGWSIIFLTILINAAIFPLRHKSVVSMRKMQQLQPQVKAIQDRYANLSMTDPKRQKQNEEMMALYREKGVNPASGCLPMLLTLPILFAFYSMLSVSIELRGQPFALWIHDLSQHDPYYITPVLMGLSMLWQQRMTPVADPQQAKIMMFTPIMFLFFFLWAPSGLVLYWLVSNLLGIGQQLLTNRLIGPAPVAAPRPPAERRLKQAGAGQTDSARGTR
jgi:YidC/Oxa1 family membrane protein insertase